MNDIQKIRENIRKNQIFHKNFNPIYEMEEGQKYYKGIYTKNNDYCETFDESKNAKKGKNYDILRK